jgi:CDP-paratose 2-epimerase
MSVALITGSAGLIGAESCRLFAEQGFDIVGIDNDMRRYSFGAAASTPARRNLEQNPARYRHVDADIGDEHALADVFSRRGKNIAAVVPHGRTAVSRRARTGVISRSTPPAR